MAKRPTPKKRREKSKGRNQYAEYVKKQVKKLRGKANSPYAKKAEPKNAGQKAMKGVTRIAA